MKNLQSTDQIITEALSFCKAALMAKPKDPDILLLRGIVYLISNQPRNAVLDFTDVIDRVSINERSYFLRSKAYYEMEEFDLAVQDYVRAMRDGDNKSYSYTDQEIEEMKSGLGDVKDINNVTNLELEKTLILLTGKYEDSKEVRNLFHFQLGLPLVH